VLHYTTRPTHYPQGYRKPLPTRLQKTIASYVSILNGCDYSLASHWANAAHLINDSERASKIERALKTRAPPHMFSGKELALLIYAQKLTLAPGDMQEDDVQPLKDYGLTDGEILEANQIIDPPLCQPLAERSRCDN